MIGDHGSTKMSHPSIHSPFVCQVIRLMAPTGLFVSAIYCAHGSFVYIKAVLCDVMHLKSFTNGSAYG